MLSKKTTAEIQEEDDDDLPEDYAPIGAFAFWAVIPIMGWMISMTRWWYFGVSIPEINLELSPHGIRLVAFVMALILAGIGVFTTWWEPTVANFGINVAFPIVFVCVLFTAEKNFIITCIMVCFSILLPVILGIRKYLRWKDRKYLSAIRRRQEKMNIYVWIRKKVFCLLALGAVPWAFGNYFIGSDIPDKYIMYSEEIDFSQKLDKSKYPLLQNLDEMWNGYSAEEKLS
ncbi:MAG: hypothetical protein IJ733_08045, partial [Lachnospiraceae bacterium]|nr:hypothetical protein [Lachnospiraceae bacterium]